MTKKEKNKYNKTLKKAYGYFEELGIEPMLSGHTLLFAYRNKDFLGASNNVLNLGCKVENLTDEIEDRIRSDGYYSHSSPGELPQTLLYFTFDGIELELLPYHLIGNYIYMNIGNGCYHRWPKDLWGYGNIKFLGNKYRTHKNVEKWIETYYGPTWKIRDKNFHWTGANNFHRLIEVVRDIFPLGVYNTV